MGVSGDSNGCERRPWCVQVAAVMRASGDANGAEARRRMSGSVASQIIRKDN